MIVQPYRHNLLIWPRAGCIGCQRRRRRRGSWELWVGCLSPRGTLTQPVNTLEAVKRIVQDSQLVVEGTSTLIEAGQTLHAQIQGYRAQWMRLHRYVISMGQCAG